MLNLEISRRVARIACLGALVVAAPVLAEDCSCVGDLDHDHVVSGSDLGQLLSAWGTANAGADLDGNGVVNGADLGLLLSAWGACPTVANDECANAIPVVPGTYPFCTTYATSAGPALPSGSCGTAANIWRDVWYVYTAQSTGQLTVSTCTGTTFDSVVAVYSSILPGVAPCPTDGVGTTTFVGCADDTPGCLFATSTLTVNVVAGHIYRIRVGGYFISDAGTGTLNVSFAHPGESCANPRLTTSSLASQTIVGSTLDNVVANLPGTCFGQQPQGPAEWVRWTAPCNGLVTFSTCNPGTNFDTVITVLRYEFDGNCWSTYIACNDDSQLPGCDLSGTNRKSSITVSVDPGEVLFAVVSGWSGAAGTYELKIDRTCQ